MNFKVGCWIAVAALAAAGPVRAQEVEGCGTLSNGQGYGPFDYQDPGARQDKLPIVEQFHFTPQVEALVRGQSGHFLGDIDYTLRAFPNHHRALASISRYALKGGKEWVNPDIQSADCYFLRAIAFSPNDAVVHVIYGNYLFKRGRRDDAKAEYEAAVQLAPASPDISYNAGLYFLEVGDIERAKALAKVAYDQGYPLPGLKAKLESAESKAKSPKK
jgi:tetratricopeptide (TPR) repeat protein